jgi:preprotein translocase subunit SecE
MKGKRELDTKSDAPKWLVIVLLTVLAIAGSYYFKNVPATVLTIGWIFWLVGVLVTASFTSLGKTGIEFAGDAHKEMLKVVWPTRQETVQMTLTIIIVVAIVSMILWAVDSSLLWAVGKITQLR